MLFCPDHDPPKRCHHLLRDHGSQCEQYCFRKICDPRNQGNRYKNICSNTAIIAKKLSSKFIDKINHRLPRVRGEAGIQCKWSQRNFGGNRSILTLDWGDSYTTLYINYNQKCYKSQYSLTTGEWYRTSTKLW